MNNKKDILAINDCVQFLQNPIAETTAPKELEKHLDTLQNIVDDEELLEKMQITYIMKIFSLSAHRFYEITTGKQHIVKQEYLMVKYVSLLCKFYQKILSKNKSINKDVIVILLWGVVSQAKAVFEGKKEETDLKSMLLEFYLVLIGSIKARSDFKVEQVYPKCYSLCSAMIHQQLSLKHFGMTLELMSMLIESNSKLRDGVSTDKFTTQSLKRLLMDVKHFVSSFGRYQYGFQKKLQKLAILLLSVCTPNKKGPRLSESILTAPSDLQQIRKDLFGNVILLVQLCRIEIQVDCFSFQEKSIIEESYRQLYIEACSKIKKLDVGHLEKKKQLAKLEYFNTFVTLPNNQEDPIFATTITMLNHVFHIQNHHNLITIPEHASTIPIDQLKPHHNLTNYPIKGLPSEYKKELFRMLVEVMPFYQLQPSLVETIEKYFKSMSYKSKEVLLRYMSDELLKYEYRLKMPLIQLYKHIRILCIIKLLVDSLEQIKEISVINSVFYSLASKSEAVKNLQASYIEQEITIAITIDIIAKCRSLLVAYYGGSFDVKGKIKQSQITMLLIEKVLNELSEPSYIIRLISTIALLDYAGQRVLEEAMRPFQTTIIQRNKNNLELILNLLGITSMNEVDYQELAEYYLNHRGSEPILTFLLPKVSIQMGRKCLLTAEKWWLLFTKPIIEWLNLKEMKKVELSENFATNTGQNVSIKNALGVIIIELQQKWIFYLRTQKRESIIDILINLAEVNKEMVFFRSGFSKVIKELYRVLLECMGREEVQISTVSRKKNKEKETIIKQTVMESDQIEFYGRLRKKIYTLFTLIPANNFELFSKEALSPLVSLLQQHFQKVKKAYLFEGSPEFKADYDLLKLFFHRRQELNDGCV